MRRAFGMIQVILFMVILSTILTITMKYASITTKQTEDLYLKESAELFMQSAIEIAILGISSDATCLNELQIILSDKRFIADINITNYYLSSTKGCEREKLIKTEESNGMVMMDIVVRSDDTNPKNTRPIRLTRRTMQRP